MSNQEREHLLEEIDEIRTNIQKLEPEVYELGLETSHAQLTSLRKELARDMERLHEWG